VNRAAPLIALTALLPAPALFALHFADGPPARVSGGFGEDSCAACHFDRAVNDASGRLTLAGFPERYEPGATYELELTLSREPAFAAAGFQLAVRLADGLTQAGTIEVPAAEQLRIGLQDQRGVRFAHHRLATTAQPATNTARWKLSWTAPAAVGTVWIHAAAVAADGDESQLGDRVYTTCQAAKAPIPPT
jgi:hypothetical protein